MTVVGDERVPTGGEQNQPKTEEAGGLFYRICCCCSTSEKEPPVQLIRSGSLTYQQGGQTTTESQPQISAANNSIDDEDEKEENGNKPRNDENNKEEEEDGFNVNDILMDGVIKNAEEDKTEALEEDVTSISTDVVQEVDESDLQKALEPAQKTSNDSNEFVKPLKGRKATITNEDSVSIQSHPDEENRKMSVIEFIRSEADVVDKQEVPPKPARDPEVTRSEISDSSEEEEFTNPEFKEATISLSEEEEEEEEDEMSAPPPLPLEPPPRLSSSLEAAKSPIPPPRSPRQSKMYENADESETSEDEDETPPASGLSKMQPVTFAPSPKPIDSTESESESLASSDEEEEEKEVEQLGVTRISVKSNGQAQIHSPRSPVSVSLDADRQIVTDDEFSEKLI